jgi:transposase
MHNLPYVLGTDVSKDKLDLCMINTSTHSVLTQGVIPNKISDIKTYLTSNTTISPSSICVTIEPPGDYWFAMANTALSLGCKVVSAPPRAAKKFLDSINLRARNDKISAEGLALYGATMELHDYSPKPETARVLDELLNLRKSVSANVTYYTGVSNSGKAGCDIASELLVTLKTRLADLDKRIATAQSALVEAKNLRTVPGFGPVVSAALASKLTSYNFVHSDSFVGYIGFDLKISDSGKKRGRRVLSKNGDPELRRLLYLAAQSAIRAKDSPFAKIYQTHRDRGLSSTAAICVVARKLARTAWSIVRFGTEYDPERVFKDLKTQKKGAQTQETTA